MAQDISLLGAVYSDVPAITLPKSPSGTATFTDVTDTTATAADVAQGTYFYTAAGVRTAGTMMGGGVVTQDQDGYLVLDDDAGASVTLVNKTITANGTYSASTDNADGYSNVTVAVGGMSEAQLKNFIQRSSSFTDIDWPEGITTIGSYAFAYCQYFNPSSLPSSVTIINPYAFRECNRLALTSLPSGIKSIGAYAFYGCTQLALNSLPSDVKRIEEYTFRSCSGISLTSLPSEVTTIGNYAFQYCYGLQITTLPSTLTYFGNYAFHCCDGITSISCDGVITTLAQYAFVGNSSHPMQLTSVSFPYMTNGTTALSTVFGHTTAANACQLLEFCDIGSTTSIAASAFANCYSLETLVLRKTGSVCSLANVSAFTNTPMSGYNGLTGTVYVPSALISSYKAATNWSTLYNNGTVDFEAIEGSDYELD